MEIGPESTFDDVPRSTYNSDNLKVSPEEEDDYEFYYGFIVGVVVGIVILTLAIGLLYNIV